MLGEQAGVRFAFADLLALVCAVVLLVGFVLLPWSGTPGSGKVTGLESLQDDQAGWLILAAGMVASLAALWGMFKPKYSRLAGSLGLIGGLVALVYYVFFMLGNFIDGSNALFLSGLGFWLGLAASAGLMVQVMIPRPPLPDYATSDANYLGFISGPSAYFLEQTAAWIGSKPLYMAVFFNLALMTIIEVVLTDIPGTMPVLVVLSVFKVVLVAMYYMHLKADHWMFTAIIIVPLPFVLVLTLVLLFGL